MSLQAATEPVPRRPFRRLTDDEFELFVPEDLGRLPDELHLELRGRRQRQRVEAYWDGCAYVI